MATTYKIMNITKDKQLIGQDITLTKANSKIAKSKYVTHAELKAELQPIKDTLAILIARGK
ncbi:MAG: hypothetical protein LBV37_01860 [Mycoplasmataceae bacterium]|jgi:hypothetical protein|nr:hypothetical protein [Mycoplasmataceae bacterium]